MRAKGRSLDGVRVPAADFEIKHCSMLSCQLTSNQDKKPKLRNIFVEPCIAVRSDHSAILAYRNRSAYSFVKMAKIQ